MKRGKLWYRSRGIKFMESRFGKPKILTNFISKRLSTQKEIRILEIGFGEGKCLLDLRELFSQKNVKLYGINWIKQNGMHRKSDFLANAKKFGNNIKKSNLPTPYFYDAGEGLRFDDNFFDLVISQVAFHYVPNKAKLLEEIWRTLKKNGKAYLHIDSNSEINHPDWFKFNPETPRFIIYNEGKIINLSRYLEKFKSKNFPMTLKNSYAKEKEKILIIKKDSGKKLDLKLEFDGNSYLNLMDLKKGRFVKDNHAWFGCRSVFKVK